MIQLMSFPQKTLAKLATIDIGVYHFSQYYVKIVQVKCPLCRNVVSLVKLEEIFFILRGKLGWARLMSDEGHRYFAKVTT